jgi:pimeloyl-ACP methyl ester carboxylesterase
MALPLGGATAVRAAAGQEALAGIWYGRMPSSSGDTLRLALEVAPRVDGTLAADLILLDQGANGAPSSSVSFNAPLVQVEFRGFGVTLDGPLSADGQALDLEYRQGSFTGHLPLQRVQRLPGLAPRWQNPVRPYPYDEEEVVYPGGAPGQTLAGTLVMPRAGGPFPAVVLVTGSGPQGRDALVGGHRLFLVLADHLVRQGIAVLRYDERGVGQSTGRFDLATTADFADDAMAGATYLRGRPEVDPGRIGIVGGSEGGMVAPMVASRSPELGFIVLLAGPGIRLDELIVTQIGLFALEGGASEAQVEALRAMYRAIHRVLNTGEDRAAIYAAIGAYYDGLTDAEKGLLGWSRRTLNAVIESRLTPWWRYFLAFDPAVYLGQVRCPVLVLNGDRDLNVPAAENLAAIDRALRAAGNTDYRVVQMPGLNHLLNGNGEGEPADTSRAVESISPEVLDLVSTWIRQHAGLGPLSTAVEERAAVLPPFLSLAPNYPNPFNGDTAIRFSLPTSGAVELALYNLAGQRVALLASGKREAGAHVVNWDGRDEQGRALASGVYLYRLQAGVEVRARKLALLR